MKFFNDFGCAGFSLHLTGTGLDTEDPAVLLAAVVLAVLLEWFLARQEKRWPGLLLPALALLWAVGLFLLGYGALPADFKADMGLTLGHFVPLLLRNSVPALGLLAVYAASRWRRGRRLRRGKELDSMRVEDL